MRYPASWTSSWSRARTTPSCSRRPGRSASACSASSSTSTSTTPRPHDRVHRRRGARAGAAAEPVQPRHHRPRSSATWTRPSWPAGSKQPGCEHPGRAARLRRARADRASSLQQRPLARSSGLPVAGRRPHPARDRQVRRGPPQRRPRHGRPWACRSIILDRGQRPLLLVVPARDLHRAAPPLAPADLRGREPVAQDHAHARAAEDPAVQHATRRPGTASPRTRSTSSGVISDIEFPRERRAVDPQAGLEFAREVARARPGRAGAAAVSDPENAARRVARSARRSCSRARRRCCTDLRHFMIENFGFGDFVFRLPDGTEVGRAHDLKSLEEKLAHRAGREHRLPRASATTSRTGSRRAPSSRWPTQLRPRSVVRLRRPSSTCARDLIEAIARLPPRARAAWSVADFDRAHFEPAHELPPHRRRLARRQGARPGLRAAASCATSADRGARSPASCHVPPSVVLATDVFDRVPRATTTCATSRSARRRRGDRAPLPGRALPARTARRPARPSSSACDYPLAVRSSSLLEDSLYQPFAGVYQTYMLPNNHPDLERRLAAARRRRSSASTPRPSRARPRPTSARRPTASRRRRWR